MFDRELQALAAPVAEAAKTMRVLLFVTGNSPEAGNPAPDPCSAAREATRLAEELRKAAEAALDLAARANPHAASPKVKLELTCDEATVVQVALAEYRAHREYADVDAYVDKRYPVGMGYSESFRARKRNDVRANLAIAQDVKSRLHGG